MFFEAELAVSTFKTFSYLVISISLSSFIKWNFTKFLCDTDGKPVKRYGPGHDLKVCYTVDSRYLDFGYLEQPLISKKKSGLCYNTEI